MVAKKVSLVLAAVLLLCGCATTGGRMEQRTGTDISLKENNYKVLKTCARGSSSGFKLFEIFTIWSPSYASARRSLYDSVGEKLEGRSIALANMSEDKSTIHLLLFSIPRLVVTGDVIEFDRPSSLQK